VLCLLWELASTACGLNTLTWAGEAAREGILENEARFATPYRAKRVAQKDNTNYQEKSTKDPYKDQNKVHPDKLKMLNFYTLILRSHNNEKGMVTKLQSCSDRGPKQIYICSR
jgi:hypothetical protein